MSIHSIGKIRTNLSAFSYAQKLFELFDTPVSLSCSMLLKYGEHEQLARKSLKAEDYVDPGSFFLDYQSIKLFSKYPGLKTGLDTRAIAREKFYECELKCLEVNRAFRDRSSGKGVYPAHVETVLSYASQKICSILGSIPDFEDLQFEFGPGASYGVRKETSVYNKVTSTLECTFAFTDRLQEFLEEFPAWIPHGVHDVRLVPGSQLTFVPKDAKTDRPICIEPMLNGVFQKGVGSFIRDRLLRFGVDLRDQSVNQRLASRAHCDGLATVDFSSASDTISYATVMDLLPSDWFELLDMGRCPRFEDGGRWFSFQKFSSMGNAYTFELETLIFYALACATCEYLNIDYRTGENLSVYGDDVILPAGAFDLFSEVSEICGFSVNEGKSFSGGAFFESCGHDFFLGFNVRPFLIKRNLNTVMGGFYGINTVFRLQKRLNTLGCKVDLSSLHSWCISQIPASLRMYGPDGYGDGHIITHLEAAMFDRKVYRHDFLDGWIFHSYVERPVLTKLDEWPAGYALYGTRSQAQPFWFNSEPLDSRASEGYAVRGRTRISVARILANYEWTPNVQTVR